LSAAFLNLARYRTRENIKPQAARGGFLLWLVPLALMQKSLRHRGDIFAYGMQYLMCKGRQHFLTTYRDRSAFTVTARGSSPTDYTLAVT
jgi:hypothetical protein